MTRQRRKTFTNRLRCPSFGGTEFRTMAELHRFTKSEALKASVFAFSPKQEQIENALRQWKIMFFGIDLEIRCHSDCMPHGFGK